MHSTTGAVCKQGGRVPGAGSARLVLSPGGLMELNQGPFRHGKINQTMCHNAAAYANTLRFTLPSLFWSVIHNRQQSHHTRPAGKRL